MIRGSKGKIVSGVNTSQGVIETIEQYYENGWTDGFPIVPPTEDAVSDMILSLIHISEPTRPY